MDYQNSNTIVAYPNSENSTVVERIKNQFDVLWPKPEYYGSRRIGEVRGRIALEFSDAKKLHSFSKSCEAGELKPHLSIKVGKDLEDNGPLRLAFGIPLSFLIGPVIEPLLIKAGLEESVDRLALAVLGVMLSIAVLPSLIEFAYAAKSEASGKFISKKNFDSVRGIQVINQSELTTDERILLDEVHNKMNFVFKRTQEVLEYADFYQLEEEYNSFMELYAFVVENKDRISKELLEKYRKNLEKKSDKISHFSDDLSILAAKYHKDLSKAEHEMQNVIKAGGDSVAMIYHPISEDPQELEHNIIQDSNKKSTECKENHWWAIW